jgi:retinoid hydroxylase
MKLSRDVLRALAAVAWADGVVSDEEAIALDAAAEACGLAGDDLALVREATHARVDLDTVGKLELEGPERSFVYAVACWLARADGLVADEEKTTLARLRDLLGLDARDAELAQRAQAETGTTAADLRLLARSIAEEADEADTGDGADAPLPPGSLGFPLIGETLAFVQNPFGFISSRVEKHGRVWKTRVLGRHVAVISGPEGNALWIDQDRVVRQDAMFPHVFGLFGGASLPSLDGAAHRLQKQQVLAGFGRKALEHYLELWQPLLEDRFREWEGMGELAWVEELRKLAIEIIARDMVGIESPEEIARLVDDYGAVTRGMVAVPINFPGTTLYKALKAKERLVAFMAEQVAARRKAPTEDGLSRILGASIGGKQIEEEHAALELHHLFLAGYIVFAELASMIMQLDRSPDIRMSLEEEIERVKGPLTVAALRGMPLLGRVVLETKRITPMLPMLFARARTSFTFEGARIPEGWQVSLALTATHHLDDVYPEPARFDPERFGPERAEHEQHPHAYAPQGPGPDTGHRCAGVDYSSLLMQTFIVMLLRRYRWELPEQDLAYDFTLLPPEPKDGLRGWLVPR